jgi:hypothetical protein
MFEIQWDSIGISLELFNQLTIDCLTVTYFCNKKHTQ